MVAACYAMGWSGKGGGTLVSVFAVHILCPPKFGCDPVTAKLLVTP